MKRSRINPISQKRIAQIPEEIKIKEVLWDIQKGLCAECGKKLGWGVAKHEIEFRSQGGDSTDEGNCQLLCLKCHNAKHGIKVVDSKPMWTKDK